MKAVPYVDVSPDMAEGMKQALADKMSIARTTVILGSHASLIWSVLCDTFASYIR